MTWDKFQNFKTNKLYKNVDQIKPKQYQNDYKTFVMEEETIKTGEYVELIHYRNVDKDMYVVLANGILIREHPMVSTINGEKALPFVVRVLGKKNYSIY